MKKLGVIIPYRNREEQLNIFLKKITQYLENKEINHKIFVIHQDNGKMFNRGMLLNIGFKYALKNKCDYVVFHDVDMLPVDVDYSYSDIPLHLSTNFHYFPNQNEKIVFDEYFGGVTLFPTEVFQQINGYSNKYWGWGYEDDDLLLRCKNKNISLDEIKIKNYGNIGRYLKFNGNNSYVKCKNIFDFNSDMSIFISFYPKEIICDHIADTDTFTIFSVPGYDFSISYNSFSRYTFCTFDSEKNVLYVNSNIKKNYKTNITVTLDSVNKKIKVYQDGIFIGETNKPYKFYPYEEEEFFYIGAGNPKRKGDPNFFKGYFDKLIVYSKVLDDNEVETISYNKGFLDAPILMSYDTRNIKNYQLVDTSVNKNNGEIVNCEIVNLTFDEYKTIKIPHRRQSTFLLLPHEENGFENNKWKDQATRWNQLRFLNEVSTNTELLENDGLSDLQFVEHGKTINKNIIQVNVGL